MIPIISVVTSVKDYIEVVHKLIESDSNFSITNYNELGSIITYGLISLKNSLGYFVSLNWFKSIWNLPVIVPEIQSAMISEISVLDGYFHNTFQFLDTPLVYGPKNGFVYGIEKFVIGLINSCFFIIPTSTAHIITLRRFVMQGLEAGYIAGLGTIAGNIFWIGSIVLGCRFFVIPWLSLDIFRYLLGFVLLVKYMWDSYNERRMVLEDLSKQKIFLLNFLLALTEQTSIYPFISNLSFGSGSSILESFPAETSTQFYWVHLCYLAGLLIGSFSLLHLTCWFWENPAFQLYMWVISSFKVSTSAYSKFINFAFLYLTMICAITSIPYYGLDYTLTNPLGFVSDDRIVDGKLIPETAFINSKASDKNTRRNRGRHGRRERWKRRIRKYRTFDASLYDQGVYDLFTIEDLNYGFDRFWLRRKIRNHRVRFRFFPGPWMRSFKKQLSKPRLESYAGPRQEFFRILFEQVYHPSFHKYKYKYNSKKDVKTNTSNPGGSPFASSTNLQISMVPIISVPKKNQSIYLSNNTNSKSYTIQQELKQQNSTLRKFVRKVNNRLKTSSIVNNLNSINSGTEKSPIYSKRWKEIFSKMNQSTTNKNGQLNGYLTNFYTNTLSIKPNLTSTNYISFPERQNTTLHEFINSKKQNSLLFNSQLSNPLSHNLSKVNSSLSQEGKKSNLGLSQNNENSPNLVLLHPLNYYLKKQEAFQKKLNYYTPTVFRQFSIENNAPYFRVMMKRYFYYYKPTLRWEKTMKVASLRKARRKSSRTPRKVSLQYNSSQVQSSVNTTNLQNSAGSRASNSTTIGSIPLVFNDRLKQPTSTYTVVGKRASRYRYQIYKDVLQHWYYSPFNRFLVKLDVDSFIRRQPNSNFLTKNEQSMLDLRRYLLSEHYNTLRWYTYMQHYRSMKTKIGGTKSFSSLAYNQQFQGTFKKIRHLFAITPSGLSTLNDANSTSKTVLKFDQPLFNESYNTNNKNFLNTFLIHEELLDSYNSNLPLSKNRLSKRELDKNKNLIDQSTGIVREYLVKAAPIRQEIIKDLIAQRNYTGLTQFLYSGQKTRGTKPITNNKDLYEQEKNYLLTGAEKDQITNFSKQQIRNYLKDKNNLKGDLWINLLKKWKRRVNDQEFMKNYISRRVEKREKREQKKQAQLEKKLVKLTSWLNTIAPNQTNSNYPQGSPPFPASLGAEGRASNKLITNNLALSTGTQKAINEGLYSLLNITNTSGSSLLNAQERSIWKASTLLKYKTLGLPNTSTNVQAEKLNLDNLRYYSQLKKEKQILSSLGSIEKILDKVSNKEKETSPSQLSSITVATQKSLNIKNLLTKTTNVTLQFKENIEQYLGLRKIYNLVLPIKRKSFENWKKKEKALNKQKKSRKEFKNLSSIIKKKKTSLFKNDYYFNTQTIGNTKDSKTLVVTATESIPFATSLNPENNNFSTNISKKRVGLEENMVSEQKVWTDILSNNKVSFTKEFKRKKSPQRRARIRRNRGVTRKRTLADSLKREFRNLRRYGDKVDNNSKKQQILEKITNYSVVGSKEQTKTSYSATDTLQFTGQKQRRSKQRKQRTWKQKRGKYAQKLRKYKKRRRNVLGKIRILSKQLNKNKSKVQIQNWWWKNFLPSIRANSDALWQIEKDKQISEKLQELSVSEILKRESLNNKTGTALELQIGDRDFKPLALPEAMSSSRVTPDGLVLGPKGLPSNPFYQKPPTLEMERTEGLFNNTKNIISKDLDINTTLKDTKETFNSIVANNVTNNVTNNNDIIAQLYKNVLLNQDNTNQLSSLGDKGFLSPNTSIPFYAGWDDSLRKFVVTNRLLSRRQAGFDMNLNTNKDSTIPGLNPLLNLSRRVAPEGLVASNLQPPAEDLLKPLKGERDDKNNQEFVEDNKSSNSNLVFSEAPLKGMNAATTLYWQIPFTTYDPDQFFALGMDGFAPIGWKRFNFRHTILKSWLYYLSSGNSSYISHRSAPEELMPSVKIATQLNLTQSEKKPIIVKKETTLNSTNQGENKNPLIYKLKKSNFISDVDGKLASSVANFDNKQIKKNLSRRLKKRNRRVKKHPRAPVWFPSGPLLNQVLPVHYIYVFYKRSRVPRDRYIKRRLQSIKGTSKVKALNEKETTTGPLSPALVDYTLRKRVKTKRKYHRKKDLSKKMPIFPRRVKFIGENMDSIYWRPMSRQKLNKPIGELVREQRLLRNKQRKKESTTNNKQPSLRVKQLRRRVQRQIIRTVWRYKPRAGGFVWPGDYLRLELVKAPKLQERSLMLATDLLGPKGLKDDVAVNASQVVTEKTTSQAASSKKRKKKRTLQEWQIQPKKYLLEKHNLRVLKKKLEKANRSLKMKQRIKELNLVF